MESNWQDIKSAKEFLDKLPKLDDGHGWFWSPQWMKKFIPFETRKRETFHPGETRRSSELKIPGELADATEFIEKLKKQLNRKIVTVSKDHVHNEGITNKVVEQRSTDIENILVEKNRLITELNEEKEKRRAAETKLLAVKAMLSPQWEQMQKIFAEVSVNGNVSQSDVGDYEIWLKKFGGNKKRILEIFIQRGRLTKQQAQILTGLNRESVRLYLGEMKRANLIKQKGDDFILQKP